MTPEEWRRLDALAQAAFERPPAQRAAFLEEACAGQLQLHRELSALLDADERCGDFLDHPAAPSHLRRPRPGGRVGPYRLLEEIGYGGWSRVYRAARDDREYEQEVAVKVVDPGLGAREDDEASGGGMGGAIARRFRVERQILAQLEHPSIARLLDGGEAEGQPYFVLELVDGQPIDRHCAELELGVEARLRLMLRVSGAVAYAHERLIVHRDLKPANLLITPDGTPKLLDFGIAKVLAPAALPYSIEVTRSGLRPMTPSWAAPEQVRGDAVTTATDVYALGLLLYLLLTGERAYGLAELSPSEVERTICFLEPPPPSRRLAQKASTGEGGDRPRDATPARLRGDLDAIVQKALAKDPARRYRTVRQLADDVERHLAGETVSARPATWVYRAGSWLRRHRWAATAAALAAAAAMVFMGLLLAQAERLETERDVARLESKRAEEVSNFLVEIFAEADPSRTQGRNLPVRRVLDEGRERIASLDEPAVRVDLLLTLGQVHSGLGEVADSVELLRSAQRQAVALYGEPHPKTAEILHRLAEVWLAGDRFEEAERAVRRAFERRRQSLGEAHPETAESRALLGRLRYLQGYFDEAETLLEEAVRQLEQARTENDEIMIEYLGDLARVLGRQSRRSEGIAALERRLRLARHALGEGHPLVLETISLLAWNLPNPTQALARLEEALPLQERILGVDHPQTARLYHTMASRALEADPERARALAEKALEIDRRVWGEKAWSTSLDHNVLAHAARLLGRGDVADHHWRRAVEGARKGTPATHPWRTKVLMEWVRELLVQGRGAEAAPLIIEIRGLRANLPHRNSAYDVLPEAMAALADHQQGDATAPERLERYGESALRLLGESSRLGLRLREALLENRPDVLKTPPRTPIHLAPPSSLQTAQTEQLSEHSRTAEPADQ